MAALKLIFRPFRYLYLFISQSLKHKLILSFFLISVMPILLTGSLIYRFTSDIVLNRVTQSSTDLIMKKISYFDEVFYEVNKMLLEATSSTDTIKYLNISKDNLDLPESHQVLDKMASKFEYMLQIKGDLIDSVMILPRKGYYPFFRGLRTVDYADDFSQLGIYKDTIESKNLVMWSSDNDTESGGYYITASSCVIDGLTDQVIGVIVVYLDIDKVRGIFEHSSTTEHEELFVLDASNMIIYHSDYSRIGGSFGNAEILDRIEQNAQNSFIHDIDGVSKVVTHYTSDNSGWRIINTVPYDDVIKDVGFIPSITMSVLLSCLIYAFTISVLIYRNIYNPIKNLTTSMGLLGDGNLDIRADTGRRDEFGKLSEGFNKMIKRIAALIENIKVEQRLKKENEIKALQSQITPHFMYNTLNCIKAMVRAGRREDSVNMITSLITLLKISFSNTNEHVTILEELNYVRSYIEIMEYRYEKNVEVVYDIDNSLLCCGILKFVLQPIVENCFIHAFTDTGSDWRIKIAIKKKDNNIKAIVKDNGKGMNLSEKHPIDILSGSSRVKFSSIGLSNIQERIRLNYGEHYGVNVSSKAGVGTTIELTLPYIDANQSQERV